MVTGKIIRGLCKTIMVILNSIQDLRILLINTIRRFRIRSGMTKSRFCKALYSIIFLNSDDCNKPKLMMNNEVFRDTKAKYKLEEWYQIFLKKIDAPSESISVETSFGSNHVLRIGNPSKPVLLCFHSMLTSSAHLVSELQLLLNDYQMFAPDLPGQSVRGLEKRFSYKDNSFAEWILEIIDGLGLGKVNALGVSLGGCAILQFARIFPAKVNCLILFVPAGTILDFPQNNRSPDQNEL